MNTLLIGLFVMIVVFTALWIVSLPLRNVSIIDAWWGPGFSLLAWTYVLLAAVPGERRWRAALMLGLVAIWGFRLAWHVARRNHGKPEDPRYAAMRQRRGEAFWWQSLLVVFWLQALILWIVGWPLWIISTSTSANGFGALEALAIACYAIGLGFEAIGDAQLARFKADPANRGRVMETGLWRYTRHPNYFGDALVWWGVFLLAAYDPRGLLTIVSPIVMTILLRWVSGVTLLESSMSQRPGYRAYVARTSPFLPWWPRDR